MSDFHPIKVVTRRTGLSPHVIRAWEKRYGAVTPTRTPTNRRVYSTEDIERLILLRRATLAGRSIGQVAELPSDELRRLVDEDENAQMQTPSSTPARTQGSNGMVEASLRAIERLDANALHGALERASVTLSRPVLVEQVVAPLLERIGENWREGSLRVASEHLASATIRSLLGNMNGAYPTLSDAPRLLVTTPAGQLHELGALIASSAAAAEGWQITYLGPSLPAEEIAAAATTNKSRAVALSIVLADDSHIKSELLRLGQLLPNHVAILIGGRASFHYSDVLQQIGAVRLPDLPSFRMELESLRREPRTRTLS